MRNYAGLVLSLLFLTSEGHAFPCRIFLASEGIDSADSIAKASVQNVGPDNVITARIESPIKGSLVLGPVTLKAPCAATPSSGKILVFLTWKHGTVYQTVCDGGIIPVSEASPLISTGNPNEIVKQELITASEDPKVRIEAFPHLASIAPLEASKIAEKSANDPDVGMRCRANSYLAKEGSIQALERVVAELQSDRFDRVWSLESTADDRALRLAFSDMNGSVRAIGTRFLESTRRKKRKGTAIPFEGAKDKVVEALSPLSRHKDSATRSAMISTIRQLHESSAVPILQGALSDQDFDVRYDALVGLCELGQFGLGPCPSIADFRSREGYYVDLARRRKKR